MAFSRFAAAVVTQPQVSQRGWGKVRKASTAPSRDLVAQATEILGKPFNPSDYLLTHCTIVASVDVEPVPNVKLGRVKVGSKTINRKYADYFVNPTSAQFVNNNGDCWSRDVLLASYQTFIGSHNFLEHVQIEEQSKGRIIDAVARDIGDSVYIDILVATDRKHAQLVKDIESGRIATLSMGCTVEETICTKCGNVALDDTELCDCIKYEKLNTFYDDEGNKRVVAELCGHPDIEENAGNTFIEASWVATPAFTGAVLRNILEPSSLPASMAKRVQAVLATPPPEWDENAQRKAAGWGDSDEGDGEEEKAEEPASEDPKLDVVVDEVYEEVQKRVKDKAKEDIHREDIEDAIDSTMSPNDTIHKEGAKRMLRAAVGHAYRGSVTALVKTASSDAAFVNGLAELNRAFGVEIPVAVYRASLKVGSSTKFSTTGQYLEACRIALGRSMNPADVRVMVRVGRLLSLVGSTTRPVKEI
jgi:hypothetical protein